MTTDRRTTDGARALLRHIRSLGMSIPVWCDQHGVDRFQVQLAINGQRWKRISVRFASQIERATGGAVPVRSWHPDTAVPVPADAVESSAAE